MLFIRNVIHKTAPSYVSNEQKMKKAQTLIISLFFHIKYLEKTKWTFHNLGKFALFLKC